MQSPFHTTMEPKPISRAYPCWLSDSSNTVISPCQSSSVHLFMLIIKKQEETASNFWSKIDNDCKELWVMSCHLLQLWSQGPTYRALWIAIFILSFLSPFSLNCRLLDLHNPQVSLLHHHHKYLFHEEKTHLAPKPKSPDLQHHEHKITQIRNKKIMNHCSRQWNAFTINTQQLWSVSEPQ
jgi:hypothetical protein